jgi:hypothetical protein
LLGKQAPLCCLFLAKGWQEYLIEIGDEIELHNEEDYEKAVYNDTIRFPGTLKIILKIIQQNGSGYIVGGKGTKA